MKNKFYASLFVGIGLAVMATPSLAKTQHPAKKQVSSSTKPAKANTQKLVSSKKSTQKSNVLVKQKLSPSKNQRSVVAKDTKHTKVKPEQLVAIKNTKHSKTKNPQLAEAKNAKHSKTKNQQLADAKQAKHGKTKNQQLADAKHAKHGKIKNQQLADAKHAKRRKHHQVIDESYEEDDEVVTETDEQLQATEEAESVDSQTNLDMNAEQVADTTDTDSENTPLNVAPIKADNSFFQAPTPLIPPSNRQVQNNPPLIGTPQKLNSVAIQPMAQDNNRSLMVSSTRSLPQEEQSENGNSLIQQRVHSSIPSRNSNNFINNETNNETTRHVTSTHGVLDSSLNSAAEKAGLSGDMLIQLTEIFAWDIDFANNLQEGDQFTVVYEAAGMAKSGNQIVAAQFVNRGKTYTAIRYKDKEGMISYYTPDGRSLRKAFLTTPIDFARVSSHFDPHRRHPILNRIRAHKGVDYAARTGTPVKAAGDGVVTFHGNKGAYGRMIVLSHGEHYETAYAHLSNFRSDLQDGEPVKQGDVIGYVGQSGLATGPHLHYEFRVDGVHRDPENLDSKQAMRLAHDEWENFHSQTIPVLTQLNQAKAGTLVAKNP